MTKKAVIIFLIFLHLFLTGCATMDSGSVLTSVASVVTRQVIDAQKHEKKCERCCKDCNKYNAYDCRDCGCGCTPEKFKACAPCTEAQKNATLIAGAAALAGLAAGLVIGYNIVKNDNELGRGGPISLIFVMGGTGLLGAVLLGLPFMLMTGRGGDSRPCCAEPAAAGYDQAQPSTPTEDIRNQYYWDPVENVYKKKQ